MRPLYLDYRAVLRESTGENSKIGCLHPNELGVRQPILGASQDNSNHSFKKSSTAKAGLGYL